MEKVRIDINCDVGEGIGNEAQLFPFISSCNIACGGHAGDETSMASIIKLAQQHQVKIGAHPSYPDRENFGRKSIEMPAAALIGSIREQLDTFLDQLNIAGAELHHIKAHGALYNDLSRNEVLAHDFLEAISPYSRNVRLYVPYGSIISELAAENDIALVFEAFADRNYNTDLSLVSRSDTNALITDPEKVLDHVLHMALKGSVMTLNGETVPIKADTFCLHGDTPAALEILMYLVRELPRHNVSINSE